MYTTQIKSTPHPELYKVDSLEKDIELPLILNRVSAGFPSPALDYIVSPLNLTQRLIKNADSTYFLIVQGESMKDAKIEDGDIIVIDRSLKPGHNMVVLAILYGELTVKRMYYEGNQLWLKPENELYKPIKVTEEMDFRVWGVVTHAIKSIH